MLRAFYFERKQWFTAMNPVKRIPLRMTDNRTHIANSHNAPVGAVLVSVVVRLVVQPGA